MRSNRSTRGAAYRITLFYAVFTALWIALSDRILARFVSEPQQITDLQTAKGWAFVVVSSVLLFGLLRVESKKRTASENALARSEERFRSIFDTVAEGVVTIDEKGIIQAFNASASRIFGYAASEAIGSNVQLLMPEPDKSQHPDYIESYLRTGSAKIIGVGRRVTGRRKNGETFPMALSVDEMRFGDDRMFTGTVRDLSDFEKMQEKLVRSRSLASLGEISASVAHEIKNPLAGIKGALEILVRRETPLAPKEEAQVIKDILVAVDRLHETVRQLLAFSREWTPEPQDCELGETVRRMIRIAQEDEKLRDVDFHFDCSGTVWARADSTLLEMALWNLLHNAAEAMSGVGDIRLSAEQRADRVWLVVRDTGPGIPEDVAGRVFEPFFTTKAEGHGLGLSICRKIMDASGGAVEILETTPEGTAIALTLPKA